VIFRVLGGGPDLDGSLVDGRSLESCLTKAPSPGAGWKVRSGPSHDLRSTNAPSTAEIDVRSYGELSVYPSEASADEMDSRVSFDGENYAGDAPHAKHWGNVLVTDYAGRSPSAEAEDVVHDCVEQSATITPQGGGGFEDCGHARQLEKLSVRGESCDEAIGFLQANDFRLRGLCGKGGRFVCLSEYLCCMLSAEYKGNGEVEFVFNG
jgi:hypothetical protein